MTDKMTVKRKTNQQKKVYLSQYLAAQRREKELNDEVMTVLLDHALPKAISYGDKSGGGGGRFDLSDLAARVDDLQRDLLREAVRCVDLRRDITRKINDMSSENEKLLLHLRYIRGMTFEEVADKMGYSTRHVIRMHGSALEHFQI
jgi:DNA-directed RNA polymerase specialized sigma subunit